MRHRARPRDRPRPLSAGPRVSSLAVSTGDARPVVGAKVVSPVKPLPAAPVGNRGGEFNPYGCRKSSLLPFTPPKLRAEQYSADRDSAWDSCSKQWGRRWMDSSPSASSSNLKAPDKG
jgi:hypothetical protein